MARAVGCSCARLLGAPVRFLVRLGESVGSCRPRARRRRDRASRSPRLRPWRRCRPRGGRRDRRRSPPELPEIWVAVPSAIRRPSAMTRTQSLISWTMSMSCSTNNTVRPSSLSTLMWLSRLCLSAGLTPAIGSSSMISFGSVISALAISSSLRWPPERLPANSSRMWSRRKRWSNSSACSVIYCSWPPQSELPRRAPTSSRRAARWRRDACSGARRAERGSSSAGTFAPCRVGRVCAACCRRPGEPSNVHRPVFGSSKPVSRLKNVVLPAPFGPIRAVISLRWTST